MHEELKGVTILHVDDEPDFVVLTKALLERENEDFSIDSTTSAEEGLKLLESGKYDVVISDYQMPGMDGLEFLQKLRKSGSTIPFIIFTGKGREEVAIEALNKGANHYLQKGGERKSLYGTLAHVVKAEVAKKRAEDKLVELEKEHQTLLNSLPLNIFHIDRNSTFVHVNEVLAKHYGKRPEDFKGKTTKELYPDQAKNFTDSDKEVIKSGKPQIGTIRKIKTPQGVRWVRLDKVPIKDAEGNVTSVVGFELDITEQRRMENELRESEEYYRSLVESTDDSIYLINKDYKYLFVSDKHLSRLGLPKDQIIGKTYGELHAAKEEKEFAAMVKKVFKTGKSVQQGYTSRKDHKYILRTLSPVKDAEGRMTAVTVVSKNITDGKKTDDERKRLLKELEAKNRELEHFTYMVSHDLRSPLVTIQGFTDLLEKDLKRDAKEKAEKDLKYIASAAAKMDELLNATLELSRIGRIANPSEDVPFGDIVEGALQQTAGAITSNNIKISVVDGFPAVHVDRMRIEEVLVNLITNSIKYRGKQPHPQIEIGHRVDGEETVFFVKDNGIGIDKGQHEEVFELFYQVSSGNGTGAGLAIVKRIIGVHEGRVWIESERDKGCTVCFTLPVN